MYGKLIHGVLVYAPKNIVHGNTLYEPATDEILLLEGYKPIEYEPSPEPPQGHHMESFWQETEAAIVQRWSAVADTPAQTVDKLNGELYGMTTDMIKFLVWLLQCKNQSDFFKKLKAIQDNELYVSLIDKYADIEEQIEQYKNGGTQS